MASRKATGKIGPGSTKSSDKKGNKDENQAILPAVASQSPVGGLKVHVGAGVYLRASSLPRRANADAMLARPWRRLLAHAAVDRQPPPSILISDLSFGLSAEHPFHFDTLADLAIAVLAAPFFGSSLVSDAVRHGILLVPLPAATLVALGERVEARPECLLRVDLGEQRIELPGGETIAFQTHPWLRDRLLFGMDDLDEQMRYRENATEHRFRDRERRPWLYTRGRTGQGSRKANNSPE